MSMSEAGGVITGRDSFTVATIPISPAAPPPALSPAKPVVQNMSFPYTSDGTTVYKPVSDSSPPYQPSSEGSAGIAGRKIVPNNLNISSGEPMKRKRGRPRKYAADGSIAMALVAGAAATPNPPVTWTPPGGNFSPAAAAPPPYGTPSSPSSLMKKARGRPPGSSKKQQEVEALGSVGIGFTPHVITVKAGEDVSAKIMSFSQHGPRAICVLSANGAISNVTLRQASTSGGTVTYEGRFDILSLSGSFLLSEVGGQRSRTGGLSVSLAGPDGRVLGGCVAGLLTAASPVQVIVGSFMADGRKEPKSVNNFEPSAPLKVNPAGASGVSSPPSRGTFSESSGGPGSPLNQSTGACNNVNLQGITSMAWK